jgi:hypothetical protein
MLRSLAKVLYFFLFVKNTPFILDGNGRYWMFLQVTITCENMLMIRSWKIYNNQIYNKIQNWYLCVSEIKEVVY